MRVAVLAASDSWYVRDLQRAAHDTENVVSLPFTRLASSVQSHDVQVTSSGERLRDFDRVLVRSMPPGSLEQIVFRMDVLQRLEADGRAVLNPPRAIEAAVDKYLTLCKLQAAGLDVPRTETSQTVEDAMEAFDRLGADVVVKPLFGSEGRGITRISDEAIAERTFKLLTQLGAVIYLQEYVPHEGFDIRLLVIDKKVWAMRRLNQLDWRTNVSRGASTESLDVTAELRDFAMLSATSVGAVMAGVDLLPTKDGRTLVLEVNAVPGWRALAKACSVDIGREVLNLLARHG
jgi:ribosomal protein S6--L-glutamate ligase